MIAYVSKISCLTSLKCILQNNDITSRVVRQGSMHSFHMDLEIPEEFVLCVDLHVSVDMGPVEANLLDSLCSIPGAPSTLPQRSEGPALRNPW